MSMIETLRDRGQTRDLVLLHGVSHDFDLAWREQLELLAGSATFPLRYTATSRGPRTARIGSADRRVESVIAGSSTTPAERETPPSTCAAIPR